MSPFKAIIAMSSRSKPSNGLRWFTAESVSALIIRAARSHATAPFRFLTYVPLLQGDCPILRTLLFLLTAILLTEPPSLDLTSLNIFLWH